MPIDREKFEEAKRSLENYVVYILKNNKDKAYNVEEIIDELKKEGYEINEQEELFKVNVKIVLSNLENSGIVESAIYLGKKYYAYKEEKPKPEDENDRNKKKKQKAIADELLRQLGLS